MLATPLAFVNRQIIIERTAALRLPAVYQWPEMAEEVASSLMVQASSRFFGS
jgi:hypothetical protein